MYEAIYFWAATAACLVQTKGTRRTLNPKSPGPDPYKAPAVSLQNFEVDDGPRSLQNTPVSLHLPLPFLSKHPRPRVYWFRAGGIWFWAQGLRHQPGKNHSSWEFVLSWESNLPKEDLDVISCVSSQCSGWRN